MDNLIILVFTFTFAYFLSEFALHRFFGANKEELITFAEESGLPREDVEKMLPKAISFFSIVVAVPATLIISLFLAIFS